MFPVLDEFQMPTTGKRKKIIIIVVIVLGLFVCPALIYAGRVYLPKLWSDLHVVNFVVAWIPAVLSILVAFVPDKELGRPTRIGWRIVVVICGVLDSVLLWHQQTLTDDSSNQAQKGLLEQAVSGANKHADEQFGKVHNEVQDVNKGLDQTRKDLTQVVHDASSALGITIGQVTKPTEPEPTNLTFSLWTPNATTDRPVMQNFLTADADGNYPVDFIVTNPSEAAAKGVEIWLTICDACTFAAEPAGFDNPVGGGDKTRHR
ncbi:MAG: hypothetical protein WBF42_18880, partial [Terracidiphilus sp.]